MCLNQFRSDSPVRSQLALPGVLIAIPTVFHVVLFLSGITLKQAQDAGWVMQPPVGPLCQRLYRCPTLGGGADAGGGGALASPWPAATA